MNIFIRYLNNSDIAEVSLITKKLCIPENEYRLSAEDIDCPNKQFFVACAETAIIGYAGIRQIDDEVELLTIGVHALWQQKKIGTELMKSIIRYTQTQNIRRITLEVRASNDAAQKLYTKTGFCVLGIRKNYYANPRENAVIMEIKI